MLGTTARHARQPSNHLRRFIATPTVAKHRLFAWLSAPTLPDHQLIVTAREDDYTFGVLHSRAHELWSLRMGTWLGVGNDPRYTPTSTFETFPFPWPLDTPDEALTGEQRAHRDAIARVALALDETRRRWLNPPELVREEPDIVPSLPPRLLPVDKDAERVLKRRTLTNLYNERPAWLSQPPRQPRRRRVRRLRLAGVGCAGVAVGGGAAGAAAGVEPGAEWELVESGAGPLARPVLREIEQVPEARASLPSHLAGSVKSQGALGVASSERGRGAARDLSALSI